MMKNMNQKLKYGVAVVVTTALPAVAMANEAVNAAKTELEGLKTAIPDFGTVVIGISVAIVTYGIIKRMVNKA